VEYDARCDPEKPPENGRGEDDPDKRGVCRANHPIQLHRARVCSDEQDEDDECGYEQNRPGVEARATGMAAEPLPARFSYRPLRLYFWPLRHPLCASLCTLGSRCRRLGNRNADALTLGRAAGESASL
jgi:hypothetical protein